MNSNTQLLSLKEWTLNIERSFLSHIFESHRDFPFKSNGNDENKVIFSTTTIIVYFLFSGLSRWWSSNYRFGYIKQYIVVVFCVWGSSSILPLVVAVFRVYQGICMYVGGGISCMRYNERQIHSIFFYFVGGTIWEVNQLKMGWELIVGGVKNGGGGLNSWSLPFSSEYN